MPRQEITGPVATVIGQSYNVVHHHWVSPQPPDDPEKSRICPQCQNLTWRYTHVCIHCKLDLHAWDRRERGLLGIFNRLLNRCRLDMDQKTKWGVATAILAGIMLVPMMWQSSKDQEERDANVEACAKRGVQYFMDIGSYPKLSDGRIPYEVAIERCRRTLKAFE